MQTGCKFNLEWVTSLTCNIICGTITVSVCNLNKHLVKNFVSVIYTIDIKTPVVQWKLTQHRSSAQALQIFNTLLKLDIKAQPWRKVLTMHLHQENEARHNLVAMSFFANNY